MTIPWWTSTTAYLTDSWLPSISEVHLLHLQPEAAPLNMHRTVN